MEEKHGEGASSSGNFSVCLRFAFFLRPAFFGSFSLTLLSFFKLHGGFSTLRSQWCLPGNTINCPAKLGSVFLPSAEKTARSRAELTEPSRDRRERAQRLSQYFFRSVSVRVARTGSSSRDNSEEKKERGSSRWWRGGSMPRGALFCPLWRPPACPPRIPADRSEY